MSQPELILIAAVAKNGVIGRQNALPWRLKGDLQHFKRTTLGCPVIMGRKTWESLGRPLPGRQNIVITRNADYAAEGATVVDGLGSAMGAAGDVDKVFLIGGAQLYAQAISSADRLILTEVQAEVDGDAWFPEIDRSLFREVSREHAEADADNDHPVNFVEYERTGA